MKEVINKINLFEQKTLENFSKQDYIERNYYQEFDKTNFPIL
jgi:hypothetical protein